MVPRLCSWPSSLASPARVSVPQAGEALGRLAASPPASPSSPCPGLAELAARKYKQAAKCFLLASFDHCDFPEVRGGGRVWGAALAGVQKAGEGS